MKQRGLSRRALLAAGFAGAVVGGPGRGRAAPPRSANQSRGGGGLPEGPFFDVTRFGAVGNGKTMVTEKLQAAIDRCGARGGGTVLLPPGEYLSAPLFLRDNVELHLFAGARLTASPHIGDYPVIVGRAGGVERPVYASLVTATGVTNDSITGRGTLDGNGLVWMEAHRHLLELRRKLGLPARSDGMLTFPPDAPLLYPRPRVINLIRCEAVLISDICIERTPAWTVHLLYCEEVDIARVRIHGYEGGQGTSGIVLDSCKDVRVASCRVSAGDDGISIKSGYDENGRRVGIECADIVIENCTFIDSLGAGIAIGSETAGGIKNVTATNCVFDKMRWAFRIKTNRGRGGVVENILLSHLVIRRPTDTGFDITGFHDPGLAVGPPESTPTFRDIICSDLIITDAKVAGTVRGLPENWFQNITLRNLSVYNARSGFSCENVKGLVLDNLAVAPGGGPALAIRNATGVDIRGLRVDRVATGAPAIELEAVHEALITSCHTPADTKVFVALEGADNSGVVLMNNVIPRAAVPSGRGIVIVR
jgi:hypothetical protein